MARRRHRHGDRVNVEAFVSAQRGWVRAARERLGHVFEPGERDRWSDLEDGRPVEVPGWQLHGNVDGVVPQRSYLLWPDGRVEPYEPPTRERFDVVE